MDITNTNSDKIDLVYFKAKIKMLLKERDWSQTQFADYMGVSKNTISAWLNGNKKTQPRWLRPLFLMIQLFKEIDGFNPMQLFYPDWKDKEIENQEARTRKKYNLKHKKIVKELIEKHEQEKKKIKIDCENEIKKIKKDCPLSKINTQQKEIEKLQSQLNVLKLRVGSSSINPKAMTPEQELEQDKLHPSWRQPNTRL